MRPVSVPVQTTSPEPDPAAGVSPPFARSLQVDLVLRSEVVQTDGFVVNGEELDAALVHGVIERSWRLRRSERRALMLQPAQRGRGALGPAYSEVGGVASHVEDNLTRTEIQEVLAPLALALARDGWEGVARGDVFGEDHLGILIDSTFV